MSESTTVNHLPEPPDINTILQDWRSWCEQQPSLIKPLAGGLTNHSYLVASGGEYFVVRINGVDSRALDLQRDIEAQVLVNVSATDIGLQLVYCDPDQGYLVTRYIEGRQWQRSDSRSPEGIYRLANLLKAIHGFQSINNFLDVGKKADYYWRQLADDCELTQSLQSLKPQIDNYIAQASQRNSDPVLCHNDLTIENLLLGNDGKLHALDWEYAAMGDAFFDLAVIVEEHQLNPSEAQHLLQSYLGSKPSREDVTRLYSNRIMSCYLSALWYAVKIATDSALITHQDYKHRLRCLQQRLAAAL